MANETESTHGDAHGSSAFRVCALTPWTRAAAATLWSLAGTSLPLLLALVLLATDPPVTPPLLGRLFLVFTVLPALLGWLGMRAIRARVDIRSDTLAIERADRRIEVPSRSIARVVPWSVPLPGPGFALLLLSGRRLVWRIQSDDPTPLLAALAAAGVDAAHAAAGHPSLVYADAKHAIQARGPWRLAVKFGVFPLLPAAVLFNAHQHIAYGGLLGEYYLRGLGPWLGTFAVYWVTTAIYLLLYASVWRGLAEAVALLTARVAPSQAARVRRAVETGCTLLYYAGVPVLLLVRFLG